MDNVHELMLQAVFDVQNGQVCRDFKKMNISYVHHHRCCPSHLNQTHQQSPASSRLQSPYGPMVAPPLGGASHLRPCIDGVLRGILAIAADAGSRRSSRSWSGLADHINSGVHGGIAVEAHIDLDDVAPTTHVVPKQQRCPPHVLQSLLKTWSHAMALSSSSKPALSSITFLACCKLSGSHHSW